MQCACAIVICDLCGSTNFSTVSHKNSTILENRPLKKKKKERKKKNRRKKKKKRKKRKKKRKNKKKENREENLKELANISFLFYVRIIRSGTQHVLSTSDIFPLKVNRLGAATAVIVTSCAQLALTARSH